MNKTRWAQLNPLLDELLDLEPDARARRLVELSKEDAAIANDLGSLLGHLTTNERKGFLERLPTLDDTGMSGRTIGAYVVERELGHGGMGSVWLARRADGRFEGRVAVKFLNMALAAGGGAARFAREGSILARLAHPNIARLLDAGVTAIEGQPYLILEYIAGQPISTYCEFRALGVEARVRLFLDVLSAVEHAHNRLILHRDIKPSNILVTEGGEVKLLDFGIAKLLDDATHSGHATELTRQGGNAFTPQFAAPEQVRGEDVTTATDVYALGVLLYLLLGRIHPTSNTPSTPVDQMRAVIEIDPKRLSDTVIKKGHGDPAARKLARQLRGDLDNIVGKALKKAPAERYANAAQFADDLRRYLADEPVAARRDALSYRAAKFVRRHRLGVAAGSTVAMTLAAGVSVALWQAHEARQQRVQAEGMVEFMLGDLRKKLEPVGRLDVLDAVGEKALAYYAAQDSDKLDADSLGRRSRALHLIGKIAELRGNLDEASRVFQRAAESTGELVKRYPNDGQRVFDHAQSVYWVGYMARRRGHAQDAETSFRTYLELARRLVRIDANNLEWRIEKAFAHQNLGVVHLESFHSADALKAFTETREVWLSAVRTRPELNIELANTLGWIAKAREAQGEFSAAIEAQKAKLEVLAKVPSAEQNRRVQRLIANSNDEVGRLQLDLGYLPLAAQTARSALGQLEALLALDPSNLDWLAQTSFARLSLVEIEIALGDHAVARTQLDRAAVDVSRLVSTNSSQKKWQVTLRGNLLVLLSTLAIIDSGPLPVDELAAYVAEVKGMESAGNRLDADQTRVASSAEMLLGDMLVRRKQSVAAQDHWHATAARVMAFAASGDLPSMTLLAHARMRLGAIDEARSLAKRIEASTYRHPAYADLRQRLLQAAGAATVR